MVEITVQTNRSDPDTIIPVRVKRDRPISEPGDGKGARRSSHKVPVPSEDPPEASLSEREIYGRAEVLGGKRKDPKLAL